MTYKQAEQYLLSIPGYTSKNTMQNTRCFLDSLCACRTKEAGAPVKYAEAENVIHVAGTNGKGSVCAYLSGILQAAGCRVGMFTSPHLLCITERFQINGQPVDEKTFAWACTYVRKVVDQGIKEHMFEHPTFFEILVGMAFLIFERERVDYLILETGLGGRKDATNLVKKPLASVITSIGYDHTEYLGETLEAIAGEKAGIIKEGVPVIYDGSEPGASGIIEQKAAEMHAKTYEVTMKNYENVHFKKKSIDFLWKSEYYNNVQIVLRTAAQYQVQNAVLAAVTIQVIDLEGTLGEEAIAKGLAATTWRGRMEWISKRLLVDGAHNESGARQAVRTVAAMKQRVVLLYTAVKDKNYSAVIQTLCETLDVAGVVVTQLNTHRAAAAEELREIFQRFYCGFVYVEKDMSRALQKAESLLDDRTVVFAVGSLYLAAELMRIAECRQTVCPKRGKEELL